MSLPGYHLVMMFKGLSSIFCILLFKAPRFVLGAFLFGDCLIGYLTISALAINLYYTSIYGSFFQNPIRSVEIGSVSC